MMNEIAVVIILVVLLLAIYIPYSSLTDLKHLSDIAYELKRIREELERK